EAARRHYAAHDGVVVRTNVPAEDMPRYFCAAAVVASASRWEGFNLPFAEAQSYGRPVVGYACGAHPEVVAPSGRLVDAPGPFARAPGERLADPPARAAGGAAARDFAARFTWANTVRGMAASIEAALADGHARV